jgi:hypothetical protein
VARKTEAKAWSADDLLEQTRLRWKACSDAARQLALAFEGDEDRGRLLPGPGKVSRRLEKVAKGHIRDDGLTCKSNNGVLQALKHGCVHICPRRLRYRST